MLINLSVNFKIIKIDIILWSMKLKPKRMFVWLDLVTSNAICLFGDFNDLKIIKIGREKNFVFK